MKLPIRPGLLAFCLASLLFGSACEDAPKGEDSSGRKVIILGIDGLDPKLLQRFMDEGRLPNFSRLASEGDFKPLQTTMPPLSPVAWSTFITGTDPGGHGIFDFVHRDPAAMTPELSMSKVVGSGSSLAIGSWVLPLSPPRIEQLRQGKAFWEILEERGIPTTIFRMPANFPPQSAGHSLSGMGTPDLLGTSGTFSFYTNDIFHYSGEVSGGRYIQVALDGDRIDAELTGPPNPLRRQDSEGGEAPENLEVGFQVYLDPQDPVAKLVVQDSEFVLQEGEWSDWIPVTFEAMPYLVDVGAVCRFFLKQVRPKFKLYVTPLQIDPARPAMPISTPEGWSAQLEHQLGYFYTQELPEDTKAYSAGVFDGDEFWQQSQSVYREQSRALDLMLKEFRQGLLFFYFSSVDQGAHMLWRDMDADHPDFVPDSRQADGLATLYQEMDGELAKVLQAVDDKTTLIVMSDHGFGPFYWQVNLNTWLLEKGYVTLKDPSKQGKLPFFQNVDWSKTRAYALGLNGVYVNLQGRERFGSVFRGPEYEELLDQLEADLLAMEDPRRGEKAVSLVVRPSRDFQGKRLQSAPDLIVGYARGYRSSWKSPLGEFPKGVFADNHDPWSGDHGVDYRLVPGVLMSNRRICLPAPSLADLTVAVLDEFGVAKAPQMIGSDCLDDRQQTVSTVGR